MQRPLRQFAPGVFNLAPYASIIARARTISNMASNESAQEAPEPIRFRPSAKRKGYRRRIDPDDDVERPSQEPETAPDADRMDEDNEEGEHDQSETAALAALRARSSRKGRLQGVGFRSGGASSSTGDFTSGPLVPVPHDHDDEDAEAPNPLLTIQSRFTHQTGILNDIDHRHMYEHPPPTSYHVRHRRKANPVGTHT